SVKEAAPAASPATDSEGSPSEPPSPIKTSAVSGDTHVAMQLASSKGKMHPRRAEQFKTLIESIKPPIAVNPNAIAAVSLPGEPDVRTWRKIFRGQFVREDSLDHALTFLKRMKVKISRAEILNE